jgi:hypothetical protein
MQPIQKIDPVYILNVMRSMGLDAELGSGFEAPTVVWRLHGTTADLAWIGAGSLNFQIIAADSPVTLDSIYAWNHEESGSRAYMYDSAAAVLVSELEIGSGVPEGKVRQFLTDCASRSKRWLDRLAAAGAGPPIGKGDIIRTMSVGRLVGILEGMDLEYAVTPDPVMREMVLLKRGDTVITVSILLRGTILSIRHLVDGTKTSCGLADMNEWNLTYDQSRAYIRRDGAAGLESDLDLRHGVTLETVEGFVNYFMISNDAWSEEILRLPAGR